MKPVSESRFQRGVKRSLDLAVGIGVLLGLAPVILLATGVATLDTKGFGIFRQTRLGRNAKPFRIAKIRTMRADASQVSAITPLGDPRVTRLGWLLRRSKLDELPQAWNLIKGEMTLVGPRPDVSGFLDEVQGEATALLELRPGITGVATVYFADEEALLGAVGDPESYASNVVWPAKQLLNLAYLRHATLIDDLLIARATLSGSKAQLIRQMLDRWDPALRQDKRLRDFENR